MPIPPDMLRNHLWKAERYVFRGSIIIARQKALIAKLENTGRDTTGAKDLLAYFEELQATHLENRDRLTKALAQIAQPED